MSFDIGSAAASSAPPAGTMNSSSSSFSGSLEYEDSSDLSDPIFLYLSLCPFQLLSRKIQFGAILGWIVVSSVFLYVVFNMLGGRNGNLNLHTCTSLVGYCLLPVVVLSAFSLFVLGAARACSALVVSLADGVERRSIVGLVSLRLFLDLHSSLFSLYFDLREDWYF